MRIAIIIRSLAIATIAVTAATSAHASSWSAANRSGGIVDPQGETIYRPTCWSDSGEQWPRCEYRGDAGWPLKFNRSPLR
jgi:hypothetical protein